MDSHRHPVQETAPADAIVLRVSTPTGEVVIREASQEERDVLFDAFKSIGWRVEERNSTDQAPSTGGWFGPAIRSSVDEKLVDDDL